METITVKRCSICGYIDDSEPEPSNVTQLKNYVPNGIKLIHTQCCECGKCVLMFYPGHSKPLCNLCRAFESVDSWLGRVKGNEREIQESEGKDAE